MIINRTRTYNRLVPLLANLFDDNLVSRTGRIYSYRMSANTLLFHLSNDNYVQLKIYFYPT